MSRDEFMDGTHSAAQPILTARVIALAIVLLLVAGIYLFYLPQ